MGDDGGRVERAEGGKPMNLRVAKRKENRLFGVFGVRLSGKYLFIFHGPLNRESQQHAHSAGWLGFFSAEGSGMQQMRFSVTEGTGVGRYQGSLDGE